MTGCFFTLIFGGFDLNLSSAVMKGHFGLALAPDGYLCCWLD